MNTINHWIDGKNYEGCSDRRACVWNPATGEHSSMVTLANEDDVGHAVQAAARAFKSWAQVSISRRTKILFAFRELLNANVKRIAEAISDEHGKVVADAQGEVQRGLEVVEFACGIPTHLKGHYSDQVSSGVDIFSFREPLGVVAGITPFNFPVMVPLWMCPIAIACGNTFVLKPSERVPTPPLMLASLWAEAGLPEGVFNVVQGDKAAVDALLAHSEVAALSFVGSTPVAQYIYLRGTAAGKRVQALGSAKNHAVVLADADPAFAAEQLASAAFGSAGERCMAISAAVAVGSNGAELVAELGRKAAAVRVGPGRDVKSEMGPLVTSEARKRVASLIDSSVREGARVVFDGRDVVVKGYERGFFLGPTVIRDVTRTMSVYREEIFGPVLCVLCTSTLQEAVALINANPYGNGAVVFTESGETAREFHRGVSVGMVGVNVPIPVPMAFYSFGGWKASLFGDTHIHGPEGVSFYTRPKVVTSRWPIAEGRSKVNYQFPTPS